MLKCNVCFFQKLGHQIPLGTPMEERVELIAIALAQSADAVTVKDGEAVCENHILNLGDIRRLTT